MSMLTKTTEKKINKIKMKKKKILVRPSVLNLQDDLRWS